MGAYISMSKEENNQIESSQFIASKSYKKADKALLHNDFHEAINLLYSAKKEYEDFFGIKFPANIKQDEYESIPKEYILGVVKTINRLAYALVETREYQSALRLLGQLVNLGWKSFNPIYYHNVAAISFRIRSFVDATMTAKLALGLYLNSDTTHFHSANPEVATALINLGYILLKTTNNIEAKHYIRQGITILVSQGKSHYLPMGLGALADSMTTGNDIRKSIFFGKLSVRSLRKLSSKAPLPDWGFVLIPVIDKSNIYRSLSESLINKNRIPEALNSHNMRKEEEYFDFICRFGSTSDPRQTVLTFTPAEELWKNKIDEFSSNQVVLSQEAMTLFKKGKDRTHKEEQRFNSLNRQLSQANTIFKEMLEKLEQDLRHEDFVGATNTKGIQNTIHTIEASLGDMPEDGVVWLHFIVTAKKLYIILTTPTTHLARIVPVAQHTLQTLVHKLKSTLNDPTEDLIPHAKELYSFLIKPIEEDLNQANALVIMLSLDDNLRYIPFSTLHSGKNFLVEKFAFVNMTPAASMKMKDEAFLENASGFGVIHHTEDTNNLPAIEEELKGVIRESSIESGLLPGTRYIDKDFTEQALTNSLTDSQVIHVASHFKLDPKRIGDSYLVLGDGDSISLERFQDYQFRFDKVHLLTLSACKTGAASPGSNGREIDGLGWLVEKLGCKAVIATLWEVTDNSTGTFMKEFYRQMQEEGINKAEALRRSQLLLLTCNEKRGSEGAKRGIDEVGVSDFTDFTHPYYWAPFILMGNWTGWRVGSDRPLVSS